ncbi:MAG: class I SAM-dependent methyltransferase [Anaerolineaceae bacterium]
MEMEVTTTAGYKAAVFYEQFLVKGVFKYWTPLLLQRAGPKPGERVLDVACGTGVVARQMVPLVGGEGDVTGLDINPMMLAVACQQFSDHCSEIEWQEGQAENIPFPDQSFDLVTCQQGLQFFKNQLKALQEMYRVLKPGGRVALEVFMSPECNVFYQHVFEVLASRFNVPITDLTAPFDFGEPEELEGMLITAGFRGLRNDDVRQEVHFAEPEHFVEMVIKSSAAVIPAFARINDSENTELSQEVQNELSGFLEQQTKDGVLTFPMFANIATAIR